MQGGRQSYSYNGSQSYRGPSRSYQSRTPTLPASAHYSRSTPSSARTITVRETDDTNNYQQQGNDSDNYQALLDQLVAHRQQCERDGHYEEAERTRAMEIDLQTAALRRQISATREDHKAEREELASAYADATAMLEDYFMEDCDDFDAEINAQIQDYQERAEMDRQEFLEQTEDYLEAHRPRQSARLIELIESSEALCRQGQYRRAAIIRKQADQLEVQESRRAQLQINQRRERRIADYDRRKAIEEANFLQRINQRRTAKMSEVIDARNRLQLRYQNKCNEMKSRQNTEIERLRTTAQRQVMVLQQGGQSSLPGPRQPRQAEDHDQMVDMLLSGLRPGVDGGSISVRGNVQRTPRTARTESASRTPRSPMGSNAGSVTPATPLASEPQYEQYEDEAQATPRQEDEYAYYDSEDRGAADNAGQRDVQETPQPQEQYYPDATPRGDHDSEQRDEGDGEQNEEMNDQLQGDNEPPEEVQEEQEVQEEAEPTPFDPPVAQSADMGSLSGGDVDIQPRELSMSIDSEDMALAMAPIADPNAQPSQKPAVATEQPQLSDADVLGSNSGDDLEDAEDRARAVSSPANRAVSSAVSAQEQQKATEFTPDSDARDGAVPDAVADSAAEKQTQQEVQRQTEETEKEEQETLAKASNESQQRVVREATEAEAAGACDDSLESAGNSIEPRDYELFPDSDIAADVQEPAAAPCYTNVPDGSLDGASPSIEPRDYELFFDSDDITVTVEQAEPSTKPSYGAIPDGSLDGSSPSIDPQEFELFYDSDDYAIDADSIQREVPTAKAPSAEQASDTIKYGDVPQGSLEGAAPSIEPRDYELFFDSSMEPVATTQAPVVEPEPKETLTYGPVPDGSLEGASPSIIPAEYDIFSDPENLRYDPPATQDVGSDMDFGLSDDESPRRAAAPAGDSAPQYEKPDHDLSVADNSLDIAPSELIDSAPAEDIQSPRFIRETITEDVDAQAVDQQPAQEAAVAVESPKEPSVAERAAPAIVEVTQEPSTQQEPPKYAEPDRDNSVLDTGMDIVPSDLIDSTPAEGLEPILSARGEPLTARAVTLEETDPEVSQEKAMASQVQVFDDDPSSCINSEITTIARPKTDDWQPPNDAPDGSLSGGDLFPDFSDMAGEDLGLATLGADLSKLPSKTEIVPASPEVDADKLVAVVEDVTVSEAATATQKLRTTDDGLLTSVREVVDETVESEIKSVVVTEVVTTTTTTTRARSARQAAIHEAIQQINAEQVQPLDLSKLDDADDELAALLAEDTSSARIQATRASLSAALAASPTSNK